MGRQRGRADRAWRWEGAHFQLTKSLPFKNLEGTISNWASGDAWSRTAFRASKLWMNAPRWTSTFFMDSLIRAQSFMNEWRGSCRIGSGSQRFSSPFRSTNFLFFQSHVSVLLLTAISQVWPLASYYWQSWTFEIYFFSFSFLFFHRQFKASGRFRVCVLVSFLSFSTTSSHTAGVIELFRICLRLFFDSSMSIFATPSLSVLRDLHHYPKIIADFPSDSESSWKLLHIFKINIFAIILIFRFLNEFRSS